MFLKVNPRLFGSGQLEYSLAYVVTLTSGLSVDKTLKESSSSDHFMLIDLINLW